MFQPDLFSLEERARPAGADEPQRPLDLPAILERLTVVCERPRYSFMVLNLIGRSFMEPLDCPFQAADAALAALAEQGANFCLADFHAEASSEKRAMAHYLDGRIAAVLGTHTHVQTADTRISAQGTASLTDLGMCGVEDESVIGMGKEAVIKRFVTGLPQPFKPARGRASS